MEHAPWLKTTADESLIVVYGKVATFLGNLQHIRTDASELNAKALAKLIRGGMKYTGGNTSTDGSSPPRRPTCSPTRP